MARGGTNPTVIASTGGTGGTGTVDTAVVTSVAAATSSTTLLVATGNRGGALFVNDSTSQAYLKLGTGASSTSFTALVAPNGYYQLDFPIYTGQITAIWTTATGFMRITELFGPVIPSGTPVALASTIVVDQGTVPWVIQEPLSVDDNGGSLTVDGTVAVSNFPATQPVSGTVTSNQGTPASVANSWPIKVTDGTDTASVVAAAPPGTEPGLVVHVATAPASGGGVQYTEGDVDASITGTAAMWEDAGNTLRAVSTATPLPVAQQGTVTVSGTVSVTEPVSVDDNGGSLTVDGTVALDAGTLTALESITVQNGAGAAAVNVQDGGNSLTVDGTVAATQSGAWAVNVNNAAGASAVNVQDGGNSLTVDGAVTVSGTVTANQGTAAAAQSGWPVRPDWRLNATSEGYQISVTLSGAAGAGTNLLGLRKTAANPDVFIKWLRIQSYAVAATGAAPSTLRIVRATTVAAGTQITAADIPKFDTSSGTATLEVRTGAVTGTEAPQALFTVFAGTGTPSATAATPATDFFWEAEELSRRIRLTGDEGLIFDQVSASDVDIRYIVTLAWEEAS